MNILICGDSYAADDETYPEIHWTHHLAAAGHEIWNLASPGASNQLINLQVLQGINLKPDFVIVFGTGIYRFEIRDPEKNLHQYPKDLESIKAFNKRQWRSTSTITDKARIENLFKSYMEKFSQNMLTIQNYSHITNSLLTLNYHNIPFCWQIGGFKDYITDVKKAGVVDILSKFEKNHISMNLWDYYDFETADDTKLPSFHIPEKSTHKTFADCCINYFNRV